MNTCTVCILENAKFQRKNITFYILKSVQNLTIVYEIR